MKSFETARDELLYLAQKNDGVLNPRDVVAFASNPQTHLHSKFTWDDTKAAEEYRLWQARRIIKLELEIVRNGDDEVGETNLFVSLSDERVGGGGYRLVTQVLTDADRRQKLLSDAIQELSRIRAKYQSIKELTDVFKEIEKLQKAIKSEAA